MVRSAVLAFLAYQSSGLVHEDHSATQLAVNGKQSDPKYKRDCWMKRPVSFAQNPGAGIDKFTPFKTVEKDGFLEAECIKDYMYSFGDKFGDNKFSYKMEQRSNVSIVHYTEHVVKADRKAMTPSVCFEFCRTVPSMGFFGIVNGRDCYCTPYYKPMESGSSICDATCEGDATLMCGGKEKSTIWSMHMCADTAQDLKDAASKASVVASAMTTEAKKVKGLSSDMQDDATKLMVSFGKVGDSATTNLLQSAKVFAGELLHSAEGAEKIAAKLEGLDAKAKTFTKFTDPKKVTEADAVVEEIEETLAEGEKVVSELGDLEALASPPKSSAGASKQYYPVMYFIDKEHKDTPQTCGGDVVAKPIVGGDLDGCASACDNNGQECVGFSYYAGTKKLCFLFSKFKTAFYYTGCSPAKKFMLLQAAQEAAPFEAKCLAKFSKFGGTTLKPDASGKCKQCLKTLTKADRCYT